MKNKTESKRDKILKEDLSKLKKEEEEEEKLLKFEKNKKEPVMGEERMNKDEKKEKYK